MLKVRSFRRVLFVLLISSALGGVREAVAQTGDLGITLSTKTAPLSPPEVRLILMNAAASLDVPLTVAVVDRVGKILGVLQKPGAQLTTVRGNFFQETTFFQGGEQDAAEVAVSLGRTGAFFSHNEAPLSSRTIRFISGIHFPPGISYTPNAALYGIENTNRGCDFNGDQDDAELFNPGRIVPRAKSAASLVSGVPCNSTDRSGCGLGILTGKPDFFDSDSRLVNPGGIPIFRGGVLVGGIGVAANIPGNHAEFAALSGIVNTGFLPVPGTLLPGDDKGDLDLALRSIVVFIDGIRLPFVDKPLIEKLLEPGGGLTRPKDTRPGTADGVTFVVAPEDEQLVSPPGGSCFDPVVDADGNPALDEQGQPTCLQVPEGYLIGPRAGQKLTLEEVDRIVRQALDTANRTRAVIRLPIGRRVKMMISVSDVNGDLIAVFRMPDATIFSIDVSTAKSRNVVYFSDPTDPNATFDLRDAVRNKPGLPSGTAVTNRTISFAAQPLYPAGIDGSEPGPFFPSLYANDILFPCTQGTQAQNPNQSGIVFFPGSLPLYKNGELVGGFGISGDGVEQDDFVTDGGAQGFKPADNIRADQFFVRSVRSAYIKFPRNPER